MITVPLRLKTAASTLLLCAPLVAIEVIIATRSPIWRLPYRGMGYWSLSYFLVSVLLIFGLFRAQKWAFPTTAVFFSGWLIASVWVALATHHPLLGFYSIFLLAFFTLELTWLHTELSRSFIDPELHWYQGLPKGIPGLSCSLDAGGRPLHLKVSRMDQDGVFLYATPKDQDSTLLLDILLQHKQVELTLCFEQNEVTCKGAPIVTIADGAGAGIQFLTHSADLRKNIGDFVEILRGQGYV